MTTSVKTTKVYDEIIDFIAAGTTPKTVIDFKLSATAQERFEDGSPVFRLISNAYSSAKLYSARL